MGSSVWAGFPRAVPGVSRKQHQVEVCSITHLPFSGLSWGEVLSVDMTHFFFPSCRRTAHWEALGSGRRKPIIKDYAYVSNWQQSLLIMLLYTS